MKNIRKNHTLVVLAGNIGAAGAGFLSFLLLAGILPQEDFGKWLLYLAGFSFMEMWRAGLVYQALVQSIASGKIAVQKVIASAWVFMLLLSTLVCLGLLGVYVFFQNWIHQIGMELFFQWYPWVLWSMLPYNMALWIAQAQQRFHRMSWLTLGSSLPFLVYLSLQSQVTLTELILAHTSIRLLLALLLILNNWCGLGTIQQFDGKVLRELFHFGKYTFVSTLGTNLLKNTDIFLIASFFGTGAVAIYSFPLKLMEVVEFPLRAISTIAFPKISAFYARNEKYKIRQLFVSFVGKFTLLLIPGVVFAWWFSEMFIEWIAGEKYLASAIILQVFLGYILLLPLDRFIGISLDSVRLPQINSLKVLLMVTVNILGDLGIIFFWGEQLWAIATVTVLNTLVGLLVGGYFLHKKMAPSISWSSWRPLFTTSN